MRSLILLLGLGLALPQVASAQDSFGAGSVATEQYVLRDGRHGEGEVGFEPEAGTTVTIRLGDGKKARLKPSEVRSFTLGGNLFVATNDLAEPPTAANAARYNGYFVQVLDTGQLVLVRQCKPRGAAGGAPLLIRRATDSEWTEVPMPYRGAGSNQNFREVLAPFFDGNADLREALEDGRVTYGQLADYVRAYNHPAGEANGQ